MESELALAVRQVVPFALAIAFAGVAVSLAYSLGKRRAATDAGETRRPLDREADNIDVVAENPEGYGAAVLDLGGSVELVAFDSNDRIYERVYLAEDELATVADELSVRACTERDTDD